MRRILVALSVGIVCLAGVPAIAGSPQQIRATVRIAEGYYPVTGAYGPYTYASEPCAISLRSDKSTAYDVLVAARQARCISSYQVIRKPPYGHYLTCISGRCETLGFYWSIYRNGALTCAGLDDIKVHRGDEIAFSYESYPTALPLAEC